MYGGGADLPRVADSDGWEVSPRLKWEGEVEEGAGGGEKKGYDKDGDESDDEDGAEEVEGTRDTVNEGDVDDEGDNCGESEEIRAREADVFGDDGEDEHRNGDDDTGGDGEFFDVFDKLVFDAGGVWF